MKTENIELEFEMQKQSIYIDGRTYVDVYNAIEVAQTYSEEKNKELQEENSVLKANNGSLVSAKNTANEEIEALKSSLLLLEEEIKRLQTCIGEHGLNELEKIDAAKEAQAFAEWIKDSDDGAFEWLHNDVHALTISQLYTIYLKTK